MYMCGSELGYSGENVKSGLRVEPMLVKQCLKQGVDSGVRVEVDCGFEVGAARVVNEG